MAVDGGRPRRAGVPLAEAVGVVLPCILTLQTRGYEGRRIRCELVAVVDCGCLEAASPRMASSFGHATTVRNSSSALTSPLLPIFAFNGPSKFAYMKRMHI